MTILKKLDIYWLHANPSAKQKLIVYDAIIRAKLLYGLESTAMNNSIKHSLDIFQLKGLRKILNLKTTFVDRAMDSRAVFQKMQDKIHESTPVGKQEKILKPYSTVYEERKNKLLNAIVLAPPDAPIRYCTFRYNTYEPIQIEDKEGVRRRSGKPRVRWVETTLNRLWELIGKHMRPELKHSVMNLKNNDHIEAIRRAAAMNLCEETPNHVRRT